jgi:hypothetical protein
MKTIAELAQEQGVSYSGMYNRISKVMKYLRAKKDERAERLVKIAVLRFPKRAKIVVDEELLDQVLQEAKVE